MHGQGRVYMEPKGHIVLDRYPGEWEVMPSYIEEPEAAACKWVSIREDNAKLRPSRRLLHPDLHPSRDRLPASDLRRLASHADAHRLLGGGLGEVARAQGLEGARDHRRRQRRPRDARDVRRGLPLGRSARLEPQRRQTLDRFVETEQPLLPAPRASGPGRPRAAVRGADVVVTGTHARGWIIDDAWIEPGTHIAALGADLEGEQELDPRILQRARDLRRRHPPVPRRRRDQRAAARRAITEATSPARSAR